MFKKTGHTLSCKITANKIRVNRLSIHLMFSSKLIFSSAMQLDIFFSVLEANPIDIFHLILASNVGEKVLWMH